MSGALRFQALVTTGQTLRSHLEAAIPTTFDPADHGLWWAREENLPQLFRPFIPANITSSNLDYIHVTLSNIAHKTPWLFGDVFEYVLDCVWTTDKIFAKNTAAQTVQNKLDHAQHVHQRLGLTKWTEPGTQTLATIAVVIERDRYFLDLMELLRNSTITALGFRDGDYAREDFEVKSAWWSDDSVECHPASSELRLRGGKLENGDIVKSRPFIRNLTLRARVPGRWQIPLNSPGGRQTVGLLSSQKFSEIHFAPGRPKPMVDRVSD